MGRDGRPAEVALLHYPGAQLSALHGLTDLFGVASDRSREIGGPEAPALRVTHWRLDSPGAPIALGFDTHPGASSRPAVAIAGPSIRDLPQDPATLDALADWLRTRKAAGSVVGSVCSGAYLLGHAGLLDGRAATTHWCHAADLQARYPAARIDPSRLVVDDGDVITSGAVMAWIDLGLHVVNRLLGPAVAATTARYVLFDAAGREQRHYAGFAPRLDHGDGAVLRVQQWLGTVRGREVANAEMAAQAGLAPRTFERRFLKATGMRPASYRQHLKIERARALLEVTNLPIAKLAWEAGYADVGAFRKAFGQIVGLTPGAYRARRRPLGAGAAGDAVDAPA